MFYFLVIEGNKIDDWWEENVFWVMVVIFMYCRILRILVVRVLEKRILVDSLRFLVGMDLRYG